MTPPPPIPRAPAAAEFPQLRANPTARVLSQLSLELHHFAYFHGDAAWQYPGKVLPCGAFYLVLGGDGWIGPSPRQRTPLRPGRAYWLPPGVPVSVGCQTGIEKYWGLASLEWFPGMDLLEGGPAFIDLGPFTLGEPRTRFERRLGSGNGADYLFLTGFLLQLLSRAGTALETALQRHFHRFSKPSPVLAQIRDHLSAEVRINDLADTLRMTPSSLSRAFRRDTGMTLKEFIARRLHRQACALLADDTLHIREVSRLLGFRDPAHFSRFFAARGGGPPTAYRDRLTPGRVPPATPSPPFVP